MEDESGVVDFIVPSVELGDPKLSVECIHMNLASHVDGKLYIVFDLPASKHCDSHHRHVIDEYGTSALILLDTAYRILYGPRHIEVGCRNPRVLLATSTNGAPYTHPLNTLVEEIDIYMETTCAVASEDLSGLPEKKVESPNIPVTDL